MTQALPSVAKGVRCKATRLKRLMVMLANVSSHLARAPANLECAMT